MSKLSSFNDEYGQQQAQAKKLIRRRLNSDQIDMLEHEYEQNQHWKTKDIRRLSKTLGIGHTKVYKWCYDRRKKDEQVQ